MPMIKPQAKTIRAVVTKPLEDMLKVRAVQMGTSKEKLIGHILKEWCSRANTQSDEFNQARSELHR
jgi:hypothetical protein|tara:strand:+ start:22 stop:219 length:198 start_codon:yes stop_codon:yes gene_type:complete